MPAGQTFIWDMLFPGDETKALHFQVAWEQLAEDVLPFSLCADQMPIEVDRDGRCFAIGFKEVRDGQKLTSILVTLEDVTERAASRQAAREAREAQAIFASLLADARGFGRALNELQLLLRVAGDGASVESARRALHTLKGNAGVLGLTALSERCHEVEDRIALSEDQVVASEADLSALEAELARVRARVRELAGDDAFERIEIATGDVSDTLQMLERGEHTEAIARIRHWMLDPVSRPLAKLAARARRVAIDLDKLIEVVVVDGGVRVDAERVEPIWSALSHAISNAVDHGIEAEGVRVARGKTPAGHIVLSAEEGADGWVTVEVADDGAGIDLDAVRVAALRRGLPCLTRHDLLEALFADELTTKAEVTQTSGRGVGLAALRETCARLGGRVEIETEPGAGTRLRVRFPAKSVNRSGSRKSMRPRAVA
jgi:two-component system chemotaxis sensor kinase CheA